MSFEAGAGWPNGVEMQQALLYTRLKVNAHGAHVADDLVGRFFKSKIQAALANFAAMLDFPVPAVPDTSTLLPRKNPFPPSISSKPVIPVETRVAGAL